ncbi:MAG: hypothetical protein NTW22_07055 [Proteobacteria bacterium]|nr:hypothetical protein [Pseudomonadota bacterium]
MCLEQHFESRKSLVYVKHFDSSARSGGLASGIINFQGTVTKLPHNISDEIFNERPLAAQAVATISTQSAPMTNEQKLRTEVLKLLTQQEPMSRPKTWHAYHIEIETIEFWHGSKDRFHHRLRYELKNKIWQHLKLQP